MSDKTGTEIPAQVREMAEQSVEQARKTWGDLMDKSQEALANMEDNVDTIQSGVTGMNQQARSFAETSVAAAFDFAQAMAKAKDVQEMMSLQQSYMTQQMQALGENTRTMGETAMKAANDLAKKTSK